MKRVFIPLLSACFGLFFFTACKKYDYTAHLSDVKSNLFCAVTEEFTLTLACVSRERPFLSDGVAGERANSVEITLSDGGRGRDYCVYVLDTVTWGGDMSFRNVTGDYFYSKGVETFPEGSVNLRVTWENESREICATSVKNEKTLSCEQILQRAIEEESEIISSLTQNRCFYGEFHVRLLRRDKNYYYVGIVDTKKRTVSLLFDGETGELLARRVN